MLFVEEIGKNKTEQTKLNSYIQPGSKYQTGIIFKQSKVVGKLNSLEVEP
jgi:hypothetical protein